MRFGISNVHIGVLSILISSLEISVNGDNFTSVTLLASSRTFVLLLLMASASTEKKRRYVYEGKTCVNSFTHHNVGIVDH